jgi:hypothetical protein
MSLLTLIQDVSKMIGLSSPTAVTTSADQRVLELLVMANVSGEDLSTRYEWQELTRTATWASSGTIAQGTITSGTIASDFGRFIDDTFWDRSLRQPIVGPVTAQEWQADLSNAIVSPPYKFIVQNNILSIGPTPITAGNTLAFNYITKNWCASSTGTGQSAFAADDDETLIPQRLFRLDLIWRWKSSKGLAYAEDLENAEREIDKHIGANGGRRVLFIGGAPIQYFAGNIPAGDWPSA